MRCSDTKATGMKQCYGLFVTEHTGSSPSSNRIAKPVCGAKEGCLGILVHIYD